MITSSRRVHRDDGGNRLEYLPLSEIQKCDRVLIFGFIEG